MRIAVVYWSNRRFGGTGTYFTDLFEHLHRQGHDIALFHERDAPTDHSPLVMAPGVSVWGVEALGLDQALAGLRAWKPDILFAHGLLDPRIEARILDIAPAAFFAHDYYGTCISGFKTHMNPTIRPCDRTFGWQCLAEYYPRRCGGWSPVSMVREFRKQASRLELLRRYRAIVTHSDRMCDEYRRHGFDPSRVFKVPYGVAALTGSTPEESVERVRRSGDPWRLLFVGRMYRIKGGRELLQALPMVARALDKRVHLTFAGDGAQRAEWEEAASVLCSREPMITAEFKGWVDSDDLGRLYDGADLVVMPSLWPEPFGLVGSEAGRHGLPVAAFDVGGIPEWLRHGVNGHLANGNPPTVDGLAGAIIACLQDERTHARLRQGARALSGERAFEQHMTKLLEILHGVAQEGRIAAATPYAV